MSSLKVVIRETHVSHTGDDVRDPVPPIDLFEYVVGKFNENDMLYFLGLWGLGPAETLRRKLLSAGFRPVYIFEHRKLEAVLFAKITDTLYAILAPSERDEFSIIHPIYVYCSDFRIELPWIARKITMFYLDRIRYNRKLILRKPEVWGSIIAGLDEVHVRFDFCRRTAKIRTIKVRRIPVYVTYL